MPGVRILLVDDDPPLLKLMRTYLRQRGYDVLSCATSEEAWRVCEENPHAHALAVIDSTLDGMSGEELARAMLASDPRVRVILTSGYPTDIFALDPSGAGRVVFLQKPFSADALAAQVERLLAG